MGNFQIQNVKKTDSQKLETICKKLDMSKTFVLKKYINNIPNVDESEIETESTRIEVYGVSDSKEKNLNLFCQKNRISRNGCGRDIVKQIIRDFYHLL